MSLIWHTHLFSDLSLDQFHDILKLRVDVFVVEQDCPYEELDGKDRTAIHVHAEDETGRSVAYARILPPTDGNPPAIGRVVVDPDMRRSGLGHELMSRCIDLLQEKYGSEHSILSAQDHLRAFYEKHGYKSYSDVYDLDGIPHVDMVLDPTGST